MRLRTLILVTMIALFAAFVALNWGTFFAPTTLNLVLATVEAPLGIVLLGVMALMALAFLAYMALWQGSVLIETRRHTKEMQQQRALADQAEASRFNELRAALREETAALGERIAQAQRETRQELQESANSIAAMIAEFDQRLANMGRGPAPGQDPAPRRLADARGPGQEG